MATDAHLNSKDPEKTTDLPPYGSRNADPITDTPGSHPIETGFGAALGGAASGMAVGMVAGPIGAAIGAAVGAIAGGYAGKGVGELIDPTTQDNWLRESAVGKDYIGADESYDTYAPAYQYGGHAEAKYTGKPFTAVEHDLRSDWESTPHAAGMSWDKAKPAVKDAYDRTVQLREEKLNVHKDTVKTGDVNVRKEVHTEHKTVTVPVEREELVIERRAVSGVASPGDIRADEKEIRIPLKEERVNVTKDTVVKEEVSVGTRKVTDQKTVGADLKKEELRVETDGTAEVRERGK